ncbi:hypothetical protein EDB80DRAFT_247300 [Ilyonectria destructans]|nr:hypothetical protein EDB80DRAFT_247300 [Ilyonectria destructans]
MGKRLRGGGRTPFVTKTYDRKSTLVFRDSPVVFLSLPFSLLSFPPASRVAIEIFTCQAKQFIYLITMICLSSNLAGNEWIPTCKPQGMLMGLIKRGVEIALFPSPVWINRGEHPSPPYGTRPWTLPGTLCSTPRPKFRSGPDSSIFGAMERSWWW